MKSRVIRGMKLLHSEMIAIINNKIFIAGDMLYIIYVPLLLKVTKLLLYQYAIPSGASSLSHAFCGRTEV